jgi:hypothetical protein
VLRRLALPLLVAAATACGGEPVAPPTSSATAATPSPTANPSTPPTTTETPSPTPSPDVDDDVMLPARAPTSFPDDVAADALTLQRLAPPGATLGASWAGAGTGAEAVAFAWARGDDPLAAQTGVEVWVRFPGQDPAWRVMYASTNRPSSAVLGVRLEGGDVTNEGATGLLTFDDLGGSGACGIWRVVQIAQRDATRTFERQTCDTDVRIVAGDLEIRAAVYAAGDAHCCPSAYRITRLRWTGDAWKVVDRTTEPA